MVGYLSRLFPGSAFLYDSMTLVHVGDVSSGLSGDDRLLLHSHIVEEVLEDEGETYVRLDKPFVANVWGTGGFRKRKTEASGCTEDKT